MSCTQGSGAGVRSAVSARVIVVGTASGEPDPNVFPAGLDDILAVTESETDVSIGRVLHSSGRDNVTLMPRGRWRLRKSAAPSGDCWNAIAA